MNWFMKHRYHVLFAFMVVVFGSRMILDATVLSNAKAQHDVVHAKKTYSEFANHEQIKIKDGVNIQGLHNEMIFAIWAAVDLLDPRYNQHFITITSGREGKHILNSLHYSGDALDIRRMYGAKLFTRYWKEVLGNDYDIILYKDHIHIEYQP